MSAEGLGAQGAHARPATSSSAGAFSSSQVEVHRVRRRASRTAANVALGMMVWPVIAAVALAGAEPFTGVHALQPLTNLLLWLWPLSWVLGAPAAMITSIVLSLRRKLRVDAIAAKDGALDLDDLGEVTRVGAARIQGAIVRASATTDREAEIALTNGDELLVRVKDRGPKGADDLVAGLGFAGAKRKTVVSLGGTRSPLWSSLAAVVLGLVSAPLGTCATAAAVPSVMDHTDTLLVFMGVAFVVITMIAARVMTPQKLVLGADGVELHGAFRRRFFPRSRIFGVEKMRGDVSLLLRDGDVVKDVKLSAEDDERRNALVKCIRDALEEQGHGHDPRSALLSRGQDSVSAWRERVRKLAGPNEGYRASAIPVETLVRTLSDADAPADVRVGAALAIASSRDQAAKEQLRIATDAIVDEDLRIALETAAEAEADDEAIQSACMRVEKR